MRFTEGTLKTTRQVALTTKPELQHREYNTLARWQCLSQLSIAPGGLHLLTTKSQGRSGSPHQNEAPKEWCWQTGWQEGQTMAFSSVGIQHNGFSGWGPKQPM